jgi:hypothetical protein
MVETPTYPVLFFYVFGILGFIFLLKKPQYTFWMGIFYFASRELQRSAFTRLPQFGPYLNLDDFIILLMLLSLIHISFSRKIKLPSAAFWVALCIFASILIIALKFSFTYPVQREHKVALYFLFGIFLSYNFVEKEKDLEIFLKILFIGSIIASIQYILVAQEKVLTYGTGNIQESVRSVGFMALIPTIIISSIFIKMKWLESNRVKLIFYAGLSLMIVNLVLSQTRSLYISIILTVIIIYLLRKEIKLKTSLMIIIPFLVYIIFDQYLGSININEIIFGRMQLLSDSPATDVTTIGRLTAIESEFSAFLASNIIFGNGLGFTYFLPEAYNPYIAWGHIGPIAYLSRLGLLGFIIYSIYIPVASLNMLLRTKINSLKTDYTRIFIIFGTALIIGDWISFWMSASYLGIGAFLPGTVIGIVWAIKDKRVQLTKYSVQKSKYAIPENQYSNTLL